MAESNRAGDRFGGNGWWSPRNRDNPNEERQSLLNQALAGSSEAHGELLISYWRKTRRFFSRALSKEIALKNGPDDLAQEACRLALKGFGGFSGTSLAQYRKWLMTICKNLLCAVLRRYAAGKSHDASREEPLDEQAVDSGRHAYGRQPSPEEMLAALEVRAELHDALGQLPAEERQAVQARYFEKLSLAQVALRLGLTVNAVKRTLKHAFQALKRRLARGGP